MVTDPIVIENTPEMYSLYKEQENILIRRGELEAKLMEGPYEALQPNQIKGVGSGGGFGGGSSGGGGATGSW